MYTQLIGLICSNYAIMTKISTYVHPSALIGEEIKDVTQARGVRPIDLGVLALRT